MVTPELSPSAAALDDPDAYHLQLRSLNPATERVKRLLLENHWNQLTVGSGIDPDVVAERGYTSILRGSLGDAEEGLAKLKTLGVPKRFRDMPSRLPGLVIPIYRPTGERISVLWRSDNPPRNEKGQPIRYAQPAGTVAHVSVHPRNAVHMADPTVPLWITEGDKKADKLTSEGICAVSVSGVFNWRASHGTLGDWEDVMLKGRTVVICFDSDARKNASVMRAMRRLGAWLRSKGVGRVLYLIVPADVNGVAVKGVDDYFIAGGKKTELRDSATTNAPVIDQSDDAFSDARLAETLADDVLEGRFCWSRSLGWLAWTGVVWEECSDVAVTEAARLYVLDQFTHALEASRTRPDAVRDLDGWRSMLSKSRMTGVTTLARGIVEVDARAFDADPDVLNTQSGVVDLTTGELRPTEAGAMFRKVTRGGYERGADHPDWKRALEAVPPEALDYFQMFMGQAITGHTPTEDRLLICRGGGENGKTTVLNEGVLHSIGDYAVAVSDRMLTVAGNGDSHPTELMDLMGARLALLEETAEARRLDTQRIKKTVGTPQITARRIRQDSVTFNASHTLVITSNFKPVVTETDHGTWRRLMMLEFPFTYQKPSEYDPFADNTKGERPGDATLKYRVKEAAVQAAVLAWAVEGSIRWYEAGRVMPDPPGCMVESTRLWRSSADQILMYLDEGRVEADPASHIKVDDLLTDFNTWLEGGGARPWGVTTFTSRWDEHPAIKGMKVSRKKVRRGQHGAPSSRGAGRGVPGQGVPSAQYSAYLGVRWAKG